MAQHGGQGGDEHGVKVCEVLDVDVVAVAHDGVKGVVLDGVHGVQLDEEWHVDLNEGGGEVVCELDNVLLLHQEEDQFLQLVFPHKVQQLLLLQLSLAEGVFHCLHHCSP